VNPTVKFQVTGMEPVKLPLLAAPDQSKTAPKLVPPLLEMADTFPLRCRPLAPLGMVTNNELPHDGVPLTELLPVAVALQVPVLNTTGPALAGGATATRVASGTAVKASVRALLAKNRFARSRDVIADPPPRLNETSPV
jgi:hypothetical protein